MDTGFIYMIFIRQAYLCIPLTALSFSYLFIIITCLGNARIFSLFQYLQVIKNLTNIY